MPVQLTCPKCQRALSVSDDLAGRGVRCPHCETAFRVTTASGAERPSGGGPTPVEPADLPATIGPYEVRQKLGQGAFGVVYKGFDPSLGRDVAIKVLRADALGSARYVERFLREAKVVAQMLHGNIVPVYQLGRHQDGYFIASAFIAGRPLADAIPENGMDQARAVRLTLQLLEALAYAHDRGVMHRDVKPANAMLDDKDTLYLMDFGLAGLVGQASGRMTQDGTVMGTPAYMPPEQAMGALAQVGPAADQYSAGVVLYELLTGHVPFEGGPIQSLMFNVLNTPPPPPSQWRSDIDPPLDRICLKALAKLPAERFPSCRAFAETLQGWLAARRGQAPPALEVMPAGPATVRRAPAKTMAQGGQRSTLKATPARPTRVEPPSVQAVPAAALPGISRRTCLVLAAVGMALLLGCVGGLLAYLGFKSGKSPSTPPKGPGLRERMNSASS